MRTGVCVSRDTALKGLIENLIYTRNNCIKLFAPFLPFTKVPLLNCLYYVLIGKLFSIRFSRILFIKAMRFDLSSFSLNVDTSLMSNIQKLFSERIEVFTSVDFSKVSVLTGIIKIALKVSENTIPLCFPRPRCRSGFQA